MNPMSKNFSKAATGPSMTGTLAPYLLQTNVSYSDGRYSVNNAPPTANCQRRLFLIESLSHTVKEMYKNTHSSISKWIKHDFIKQLPHGS